MFSLTVTGTATSHGDEGETHDTVLAVPIDYTEQQKNAFKYAVAIRLIVR